MKFKSAGFKSQSDMAEFLLNDGECFNETGEVVFVQYGQFVVQSQVGTLRGGLYELENFKNMKVEACDSL